MRKIREFGYVDEWKRKERKKGTTSKILSRKKVAALILYLSKGWVSLSRCGVFPNPKGRFLLETVPGFSRQSQRENGWRMARWSRDEKRSSFQVAHVRSDRVQRPNGTNPDRSRIIQIPDPKPNQEPIAIISRVLDQNFVIATRSS